MKLFLMSDTHNSIPAEYRRIPGHAIVIHAGDATNTGTAKETEQFAQWFNECEATRIFVPGNHDILFQENKQVALEIMGKTNVLINQFREINGLKFLGCSNTLIPLGWALETTRDADSRFWQHAPAADIVVSHNPPMAVLDEFPGMTQHVGSEGLFKYIDEKKPKLVVCGHIHESAGIQLIGSTVVVNAAKFDRKSGPIVTQVTI